MTWSGTLSLNQSLSLVSVYAKYSFIGFLIFPPSLLFFTSFVFFVLRFLLHPCYIRYIFHIFRFYYIYYIFISIIFLLHFYLLYFYYLYYITFHYLVVVYYRRVSLIYIALYRRILNKRKGTLFAVAQWNVWWDKTLFKQIVQNIFTKFV